MTMADHDAALDVKAQDAKAEKRGQSAADVTRLQNNLRVKERELDDIRREVTALRSAVSTKDRALSQKESDLKIAKERSTTMDGEMASMAKELAGLKTEKRKLESQLAALNRQGDKAHALQQSVQAEAGGLKAAVAAAGGAAAAAAGGNSAGASGGPGAAAAGVAAASGAANPLPGNDYVATLQSELRAARLEGQRAADEIRALENVLRGKEKLIGTLQKKADEADGFHKRCLELENSLLEAKINIDELNAKNKTATDVIRTRDADVARLQSELDRANETISDMAAAAARTGATLKASELRCAALDQEVSVLANQLARTTAVASRVAMSEVKAGPKDEGTVHISRHIEEVKYMSGEINRLQDRIAALDKELAVAHELKEQYRTLAQQVPGTPGDGTTPLLRRPGSRPSSAQRVRQSMPALTSPSPLAVPGATSPLTSPGAARPASPSPMHRRPASPAPAAKGRPASPSPSPGAARPASPAGGRPLTGRTLAGSILFANVQSTIPAPGPAPTPRHTPTTAACLPSALPWNQAKARRSSSGAKEGPAEGARGELAAEGSKDAAMATEAPSPAAAATPEAKA